MLTLWLKNRENFRTEESYWRSLIRSPSICSILAHQLDVKSWKDARFTKDYLNTKRVRNINLTFKKWPLDSFWVEMQFQKLGKEDNGASQTCSPINQRAKKTVKNVYYLLSQFCCASITSTRKPDHILIYKSRKMHKTMANGLFGTKCWSLPIQHHTPISTI